jgi:hypothetical protein
MGEWSGSRPGRVLPREKDPPCHWIGGWVGLKACLDAEARGKVLYLCRKSNPGLPLCSQTLYCLIYPSSTVLYVYGQIYINTYKSQCVYDFPGGLSEQALSAQCYVAWLLFNASRAYYCLYFI